MILSYPIATPEIDQPLLAHAGETEKVLAELFEIGYRGIEPFVLDPNRFDTQAFQKAVENSGLKVVTIGTGPVPLIDKLTFSDTNAGQRHLAIERTKSIIDLASTFDCQINVGKLRGLTAHHPDAASLRDEAFREVCQYAEKKGVIVTLEPQSKSVIDNLNSTEESLAWLESMDISNLLIMLDTYHMANEDPGPSQSVRKAASRLAHLHFSDSFRKPPGYGSIDFGPTIFALEEIGYAGAITIEIAQEPDSQPAASLAFKGTEELFSTSYNLG